MVIIPTGSDGAYYRLPIVSGLLATAMLFVGVAGVATEAFGLGTPDWLAVLTPNANEDLLDGLITLIYNALGIWFFGSVVEGRIGWWKYSLCLLAMAGACLLPTVGTGGSASALLIGTGLSPLVAGVLAMAAYWAPADEAQFEWYWYYWREPVDFSVSYGTMALIFLTFTLLFLTFGGSDTAATWSHFLAFITGVALAWGMLHTGVATRDGRDLITYLTRPTTPFESDEQRADRRRQEREREQTESDARQIIDAERLFRDYLAAGNTEAALKLHDKMRDVGGGLRPDVDELKALVGGLHKAGRFAESAPFMAELIDRAPEVADPVRLKLAQVCVTELDRPGRAEELLDAIDPGALSEQHLRIANKIRNRIAAMQAEGVVELDDGAW
ncbi:MAG: rhomboid family intramembrane serine protease [Planctomycetota bacterium]